MDNTNKTDGAIISSACFGIKVCIIIADDIYDRKTKQNIK